MPLDFNAFVAEAAKEILGDLNAEVAALGEALDKVEDAIASFPKPAYIPDRCRRRSPHEFNALAVPQDKRPSANVMSATADAIRDLAYSGEPQEFWGANGFDYWVDRTICLSGGDLNETSRQINFHDTTFRTALDVPDSQFTECTSQQDGIRTLAGLNDKQDNLPMGEITRVLLDLTGTSKSNYNGWLTLDLGSKRIVGAAAANPIQLDGANGLSTSWDCLEIRNGWMGAFGCPRYAGPRDVYASGFVGCTFKRLEFRNLDIPFLFGANTCDDMKVDHMKIVNKLGGRSYIFNAELSVDQLYASGCSINDYILDIKRGTLKFNRFYAEEQLAAPIIARAGSSLFGECKYGAGPTTKFAKRAFVYNPETSGGGILQSASRSGNAPDMEALVRLAAVAGSNRTYEVYQPYGEGKLPFAFEPGSAVVTADCLYSSSPAGKARWSYENSGLVRKALT